MNYSIILIILSIININLAYASQRTLKDKSKYETSTELEFTMLPEEILDKIMRTIIHLGNFYSTKSHKDVIKAYLKARHLNTVFYKLSQNKNFLEQFIGIRNSDVEVIIKTIKNYLYLYKQIEERQTFNEQSILHKEDIKRINELDKIIMDNILRNFYYIENKKLLKNIILHIKQVGVNIDIQDDYAQNALIHAVKLGYSKLASALIKSNSNLNVKDFKKDSLLTNSISSQKLHTTDLLLKHKLDINYENKFLNVTPLHLAVKNKDKGILKLLLEMPDLKINQIDSQKGYTALMIAAKKLALRIIEMLIQYGADSKISNKNGKKAIDIFYKSKNKYIKKKQITKNYQKKLYRIEKILINS
ncbi:ankyrin repeat domain-containing protein [Candidatus Babela massiliensis]|uniref:Ankyrin repeats containing protein n=1 Tax=Candidatus Babela massiliensis TaxID=673862 RepID=V6DJE7_9BACT|nr:ankyrin repeat domain-containing protein [Candidatus Babela massiliensis]CDK31003.1 Ankyrin repeats containing protein [Candidatus Babela massiliensis]